MPTFKQLINSRTFQSASQEEQGALIDDVFQTDVIDNPNIPKLTEDEVFDLKNDVRSEAGLSLLERAPSRGLLPDIISATGRGVLGAVETFGRAARTLDPDGGVDIIEKLGTKAVETVESIEESTPFLQRSMESEGGVRRALVEGLESFIPSVAAGAPGAIVAGSIGGVPGAIGGFAAGGGTIFALAEYDRFLEEAVNQGVDPEIAHSQAVKAAFAEGGLEAASNLITSFTLGFGKVPTNIGKNILKNSVKGLLKSTPKQLAGRYTKLLGGELATELTQEAVGAKLRRDIGVEAPTPAEAAKQAIAPTIVSTLLFGVLGAGLNFRKKRSVLKSLENPEVSDDTRKNSVLIVKDAILKTDPNDAELKLIANKYQDVAFEAIKNKQRIPDISEIEGIEREVDVDKKDEGRVSTGIGEGEAIEQEKPDKERGAKEVETGRTLQKEEVEKLPVIKENLNEIAKKAPYRLTIEEFRQTPTSLSLPKGSPLNVDISADDAKEKLSKLKSEELRFLLSINPSLKKTGKKQDKVDRLVKFGKLIKKYRPVTKEELGSKKLTEIKSIGKEFNQTLRGNKSQVVDELYDFIQSRRDVTRGSFSLLKHTNLVAKALKGGKLLNREVFNTPNLRTVGEFIDIANESETSKEALDKLSNMPGFSGDVSRVEASKEIRETTGLSVKEFFNKVKSGDIKVPISREQELETATQERIGGAGLVNSPEVLNSVDDVQSEIEELNKKKNDVMAEISRTGITESETRAYLNTIESQLEKKQKELEAIRNGEIKTSQEFHQPFAGGIQFDPERTIKERVEEGFLPKRIGGGNITTIGVEGKTAEQLVISLFERAAPAVKERKKVTETEAEALSILTHTPTKRILKTIEDKFQGLSSYASIINHVITDGVQKLDTYAKIARKDYNAENVKNFRVAFEQFATVIRMLNGSKSELARGMRQLKEKTFTTQETLNQLDRLTNIEDTTELLRWFSEAKDFKEKVSIASRASMPTFFDKVYEIWINSILSGITTHVANITGNTFNLLSVPVETGLSASIDVLRSQLTGQPRQRFFREAIQEAKVLSSETFGLWSGLFNGSRAGLRAYRNTIPIRFISETGELLDESRMSGVRLGINAFKTENPIDPTTKLEVTMHQSIGNYTVRLGGKEYTIGGKQVRIPGRMLMAADEFFKAIAYRTSIAKEAYRIATFEKLKGEEKARRVNELLEDPTEGMINRAHNEARVRTFTNPGGSIMRIANQLRSYSPDAFKNTAFQGFKPLAYIVPFIRTPTNIAKFTLARTPLNLPNVLLKAKKGELKGGELADEYAKIAMGSAIGGAVAMLALQGLITGAPPKDEAERELWYRNGNIPYSIKVGDTRYGFNRLEPVGSIMGMTADLFGAITDTDSFSEGVSLITLSFTRNIISKTFVRGISSVLDAMSDPERFGESLISNYAGTLIPGAAVTVTRFLDPHIRRYNGIFDVIKARTPLISQTVIERTDLWGESLVKGGGAFARAALPIPISTGRPDPVNVEMARLHESVGFKMGLPSKFKNGRKLTPEEHYNYIVIAGQESKDLVLDLIQSELYNSESTNDEERAREIRRIVERVRDRVGYTMAALNFNTEELKKYIKSRD